MSAATPAAISFGFSEIKKTTYLTNDCLVITTIGHDLSDQPDVIELSLKYYNTNGTLIFDFIASVQQILTRSNVKEIFTAVNNIMTLRYKSFCTSFTGNDITFSIKMIDASLYWMVSKEFEYFLATTLIEQPSSTSQTSPPPVAKQVPSPYKSFQSYKSRQQRQQQPHQKFSKTLPDGSEVSISKKEWTKFMKSIGFGWN